MNFTSNNPAKTVRNQNIIQERIAGATYKALMEHYELSNGGIEYILNSDESQDVIQTAVSNQIAMVPLADKVLYQRLTDNKEPKLQMDAMRTVYKNTRIEPTHGQGNTYIDKMLVVDGQPSASEVPRIQELLEDRHDKDIIDITPEDD